MLRSNEKRLEIGGYLNDHGISGRRRPNQGFLTSKVPILTNLTAWYDASVRESIILDSGHGPYGSTGLDFVDTWKDLSGNGYDLANTSNRPYYLDYSVNGMGALWFGEQTIFLSSTPNNVLSARPISAFGVAACYSTLSYNSLIGGGNAFGYWFYSTTAKHPYLVKDNTVGLLYATTLTIPYAKPFAFGAAVDTTANQTVVANIDGSEESGTDATVLSANVLETRSGGDQVYWTGPICEMMIYSDFKGSSDRATIMGYLKNKWGTA
jgi:hypothetical protein